MPLNEMQIKKFRIYFLNFGGLGIIGLLKLQRKLNFLIIYKRKRKRAKTFNL